VEFQGWFDSETQMFALPLEPVVSNRPADVDLLDPPAPLMVVAEPFVPAWLGEGW